jgi:prepilin-type N-terminal cleavage/methylation domain-containing protein
MRRGQRVRSGLTLIEMMVAMLASAVMLLAVTGILAGNHKQWNQTYDRVYGNVVTEAYVTRQTFDRIVREASAYWCTPMYAVSSSLTLYLYTNIQNMATTPPLNRYATFSLRGTDLVLEEGPLTGWGPTAVAGTPDSTQVLAHHVTEAKFWRSGPCVHMALVIDDGKIDMPVTMTATRYNP